MWIYKWNVKIAGIGWGFSPENAWNIGDVLERTSTWYEWDWTLWTRVSTLEWEIVLKANTADVYDKTAIDTKVQQLEDEIEQSGWSSWFWKTATVGLFANASWWNFWLMNNTNQYSTNSTYNSNRADNTLTWDWALSISITSPMFWTTLKWVNRYNAYYNISWISNNNTKTVRPNCDISNQVKTDIIPVYWTNNNYTVYQYNIDISGWGSQRWTISIASVDTDWTHLTETVVTNPDFDAKSYRWYWLWARTPSNSSWEWAYFCLNSAWDGVDRYTMFIYRDIWTPGFDPFAVWWDGRYIYYITTTMTENSSSMYSGWTLCLCVFDTLNKTSTEIWNVWAYTNYQSYKCYESWNLARIYFYKYWKIWSWSPSYENYWYVEFNKNTATVTWTGSMTYDEVVAFMNAHPKWEYDNFNDFNLSTNLEASPDWYAYFNWEKVGKWYFSRWWDNAKKEYWYANGDLVLYSSNYWYVKLEVWWQVVEKWECDNHWWWIIPSIWTVKNFYSTDYITTSNPTITLKAKWLWSTWSIVLQPTNNNIENNALLNMWDINNPTTSTWLELDIDWYTYKWDADILVASSQNNANTAININWDLTKYARVLLLRAEDNNNRYWDSFEFVPKYMPSWDYKINLRYEDYYNNRYYSTISSDRTTISSNFTTYWMLMLGYK